MLLRIKVTGAGGAANGNQMLILIIQDTERWCWCKFSQGGGVFMGLTKWEQTKGSFIPSNHCHSSSLCCPCDCWWGLQLLWGSMDDVLVGLQMTLQVRQVPWCSVSWGSQKSSPCQSFSLLAINCPPLFSDAVSSPSLVPSLFPGRL